MNKNLNKINNFNDLVDSIELENEETLIKCSNQQKSSLDSNEFYLIKNDHLSPTHSINNCVDNIKIRTNTVSNFISLV